MILENGLPDGTFLNVNIPSVFKNEIKGINITIQGNEKYNEYYIKSSEKIEEIYYRLNGNKDTINNNNNNNMTEESAIHRKYISITPIHYDLTNYEMIDKLGKWKITL